MKYLIILFLGTLFYSCTEEIEFDLNQQEFDRLVVEAEFSNIDKRHIIKLSRTTSFYDPGFIPAERGAEVFISTSDNKIIPFFETGSGYYQSDSVFAELNKSYTLNIKTYEGNIYTATERIKRTSPIDSMASEYLDFAEIYNLNIYTQEPAGKGDHYMWRIYVDDLLINDTLRYLALTNDDFVDGAYINGGTIYQLRKESFKNKDSIVVGIETIAITEEFYDFIFAALLETEFRGTPFDGPPANVPGNISNGALGYFSVLNISNRYTFTIKNQHK